MGEAGGEADRGDGLGESAGVSAGVVERGEGGVVEDVVPHRRRSGTPQGRVKSGKRFPVRNE